MTTELEPQLIQSNKITSAIRARLRPYEQLNIRMGLVDEYIASGWSVEKNLKRSVRVRRTKSHDVAFEDKVWAVMAKLGMQHLNQGRDFRLSYGAGSNETKQIDVLSGDDDVILVIECKSSLETSTKAFKTEIEAIQGTRNGLIRTIRNDFPKHKIKFILATNNIGITPATRDRIESADLTHLDEDAIEYFLELSDHLGHAAKYQLLGNLFAGVKVPGLNGTVLAIQGKMAGHTYYSFLIQPEKLLKLSYVLHRNRANSLLMPTYQRLIRKSRLRKIAAFVEEDGFFPNSIILNIEEGKRGVRFERIAQPESDSRVGILHIPQTYRAAYVIDGQHRLYGYANSDRSAVDLIPVVAFVGLERSEQVRLFMQINENQQAVPKNLRNTLNADLLWDSEDLRERSSALKLRIAQHLGESRTSPLFGRIIIGENPKTSTCCITIDAINVGLDRSNFFGQFSRDIVRKTGSFYLGNSESTFSALVPYIEECFDYLRRNLPEQWDLGNSEGGFLFINNGVESVIRILSDVTDHLVNQENIDPTEYSAKSLFEYAEYLLEPLANYVNGLDPSQRIEFRRQYGVAGRTRYWRRLQQAIRMAIPEFSPLGLDDYLADEQRQFNTSSFAMISDIEQFFRTDIRESLERKYGTRWVKDGVPPKVVTDASARMIEKNLQLDPNEEVEMWDCLNLIQFQQVLQFKHEQWVDLFAEQYTRPEEVDTPGGWKTKTSWMTNLNDIRNKIAHDHFVKEVEYEFLTELHGWLIEGQMVSAI